MPENRYLAPELFSEDDRLLQIRDNRQSSEEIRLGDLNFRSILFIRIFIFPKIGQLIYLKQ
jgi:hypothetical protein